MDWIEVLSPHSKANPLSSDVQVDMDGPWSWIPPSSIPAALCSALQSFGEGTQSGSQEVQCKSDKTGEKGQATAKSDGVIGMTDYTVSTTTLTA